MKLISPFKISFLILSLGAMPVHIASRQNPDLVSRVWKAAWIAAPNTSRREFGVFHFRKTFSLEPAPKRFVIHASGDSRYELFANGVRVLAGPARGDLNHWRYETLDIARHLHAGKNVLAAVVWNFAGQSPMAQMSHETGLIVQGDGDLESAINTNTTWKSLATDAISMIPPDRRKIRGYLVVGPGERVDGTHYPWGWETLDCDDASWKPALLIIAGGPRGIRDSPSRWMLVPRTIPLMEEKPERLARVARAKGVDASDDFLQGRRPLSIPANGRATLLLDQRYLTTAYPEIVASDGRGAEITLTYAEAMLKGTEKGNRNEIEGKEIIGYEDRFISDGGSRRLFRPLWWRTFRYLQIDIQTASEPLVLEDLRAIYTAYPFTLRAKFESDDPALENIWEVGWRTARLCAHESYMDCPYYEQLQYAGDTRIQALITLYLTDDDRLVKNAIEQLDESRTPEGLTQSRYPSALPQYIPPFSLLWIGMMHDLWWYRGETEFLRQFLTDSRGVLNWFESRLLSSGLLGQLEWWNFVDWTKEFKNGVPPQEADGRSAILSLQLVAALREQADLEASFGSSERAAHYRDVAKRVADAVRKECWDSNRRLIADTPAKQSFSQHANVIAVLTDSIPAADQQHAMKTVLSDSSLTQCSYYFRYYLFRAMKKAGMGDQYLNQLGPWREMLALGLTTWAEKPEPTRSDCHAWSSHPNFDLLATVAGIESTASGFREVAIAPHLGPRNRVSATMPHPQGTITVKYERNAGSLVADITLPDNLAGWFHWGAKRIKLHGGHQRLTI